MKRPAGRLPSAGRGLAPGILRRRPSSTSLGENSSHGIQKRPARSVPFSDAAAGPFAPLQNLDQKGRQGRGDAPPQHFDLRAFAFIYSQIKVGGCKPPGTWCHWIQPAGSPAIFGRLAALGPSFHASLGRMFKFLCLALPR